MFAGFCRSLKEACSSSKKKPKANITKKIITIQPVKDQKDQKDHTEQKSNGSDMPTEKDGSPVEVRQRQEFQNWGQTVKNTPCYTFYPKTVVGVQNIVKYAIAHKKRVRVSAFQHTWAPMFGEDNEILIAMIPHAEANDLPVTYPVLNNDDELRHIIPHGVEFKDTDGKIKRLFRIGPAITNQQLRVWANAAFENNEHAYCLPVSVIMEETTIAGMVSNGCHGAGFQNQTISDNIEAIVVINAKGEEQTFGRDDPEFVSAAVDFGMFGVKVDLIMKLERMPHVRMDPKKTRLALAVPPPPDYKMPAVIPAAIMKGITEAQLEKATDDFYHRCQNSAYEEEFLFPSRPDVWTNAWTEDGDPEESTEYPTNCARKLQGVEEYMAGIANDKLMCLLSPQAQTETLSNFAMLTLPTGKITTAKPNAMHFRGGVQNMRVQDMEFEIEIPVRKDGSLDWSIVQRAWWDAIEVYYTFAARKEFPMRLPLELRIMGGSNLTMAAQRGNRATCSIEVLTIKDGLVDRDLWLRFMQAVADKWTSYTNHQGRPLRSIPHLAKQWEGLTIQRAGEERLPVEKYLREVAFSKAIPEFNHHLALAAKKGGYEVSDMRIFLNPFLDRLFNGRQFTKKLAVQHSEVKDSGYSLPPGVTDEKTAEQYIKTTFAKAKEEVRRALTPELKPRRLSTARMLGQLTTETKGELPDFFDKTVVEVRNASGSVQRVNFWMSGSDEIRTMPVVEEQKRTASLQPGKGAVA